MTFFAEPCRINGRVYPSQKAAARAIGVTPSAVSNAIRYGRENNVGKGLGRRGNANANMRPFKALGREWRSVLSAARDMGVPRKTLCRWIENGDAERILAAIMRAEVSQ